MLPRRSTTDTEIWVLEKRQDFSPVHQNINRKIDEKLYSKYSISFQVNMKTRCRAPGFWSATLRLTKLVSFTLEQITQLQIIGIFQSNSVTKSKNSKHFVSAELSSVEGFNKLTTWHLTTSTKMLLV